MKKPGGTKLDAGKNQLDLISPIFIFGLGRVLTVGAKKYAAHNWRKGILLSRIFAALMRHLWDFWLGRDYDAETGLPTLDHAVCELMFLRELWETRQDLDDRFDVSYTFNASKGLTAVDKKKKAKK